MVRVGLALVIGASFGGCRLGYQVSPEDSVDLGSGGQGGEAGDGDSGGSPATGGTAGASSGGMSNQGGAPSSGGMGGSEPATGGDGSGGSPATEYGTPTGAPRVHCEEIGRLPSPPVLDGMIDPGVYLEEVDPKGWRHPSLPIPDGQKAYLGVAWRPNGLYFFSVVDDPDYVPADPPLDVTFDTEIWQGDGVEFYVDHDGVLDSSQQSFSPQGTRQFHVASPPSASEDNTDRAMIRRATPSPNDEHEYFPPEHWVSMPISTGYVVEAFIRKGQLRLSSWSLRVDDLVGISFAHNISGDPPTEGNRLSQYFLKVRDPLQGDPGDYPFDLEANFCQAVLVAE